MEGLGNHATDLTAVSRCVAPCCAALCCADCSAAVQGKKPDLPKRRAPIANLFPSHVFDLQAPEAVLLARSIAQGEQEVAAAQGPAAAAAGKAGAAGAKGKPGGPGGVPTSHNNEKDFK